VRAKLLAVAELRTRLLWRRFLARGGIGEGVARATLLLLAVPAGLAFAVVLGVGTFQAVRMPGGLRSDVTATAVFLGIWQSWTAVSLSLSDREGVDLRRFLLYPIPPGRVYALGLASGFAGDPVSLFWLLLLAGVFGGAAFARPGPWLLLLALLLVLFAVATALYVALLEEVLSLALGNRRIREWAFVLSVALSVGLIGLLIASSDRPLRAFARALPTLRVAQWVAWPGAFAASAARHLYAGRLEPSLPWLAALAGGAGVAGRLSFAVALWQARSGGEGAARARGAGDAHLPLPIGGARGALVEKEVKCLLRHPLARISAVLVPAVAAVVGYAVEPRIPEDAGEVVRALPLFALAVYTHLALQPFWLNAFGWERGGARLTFLAPLGAADVLWAKNAVLGLYSVVLFATSVLLLIVSGRPAAAWSLPAAAALHLGTAPYLYGVGNLVSIVNPKAASFAVRRNASVPALSGLAGLGVLSSVSALFSLPVLLALRTESPWVLVAGWVALGVLGALLYSRTLPLAAGLLGRRRDELLPVVCGDDA